jgi:hypothetical protein
MQPSLNPLVDCFRGKILPHHVNIEDTNNVTDHPKSFYSDRGNSRLLQRHSCTIEGPRVHACSWKYVHVNVMKAMAWKYVHVNVMKAMAKPHMPNLCMFFSVPGVC